MEQRETMLAVRPGKTVHVSPLQFQLEVLSKQFPCEGAACLEDWLVAVANARGAWAVPCHS